MSFTYIVFGLTVRSSASIPGLIPSQGLTGRPHIELLLGHSPSSSDQPPPTPSESVIYTSAYTGPSGTPVLRILQEQKHGLFHLVYFDGMQFWMDRHGTQLWASWPSESSAEEAATYILGPVLGLLLRFRGVTCLHASAVAIGGSVIAFVGAEGAGKSTTAAAFARAGYAAVSDDVVALVEREGDFFASPSYPHLCLWPESVEMLYGTADALPPFVPNWEKRRLSFANGGARFEDGALPLRAIYLLDEARDEPGPPVEGVTGQAGLLSLVANSFATNMLDSEMRANEFRTLSSLVAKVPLRRLFTSKGRLAPADLCQAVLHDLTSLTPSS
ncbi:MAG: hypothetical protein WBQ04_07615 [Candidatus Acidiferrales bacterium]